nr:alpha/beta hydrolase [Petrachloros mirabilis]
MTHNVEDLSVWRFPVLLSAIAYPQTPSTDIHYRLVMLHGWGANAQDLAPLAPLLRLPQAQYLFPNAPLPHPLVAGGLMWYDLNTQEGLETSRKHLRDWLLSLDGQDNIPLSHTLLAGFSQGGAMTLDVGLSLPVAGLVALSGYLHPINLATLPPTLPPILMIHGRQDPVVPLQAALVARDSLIQAGAAVTYREFEMGHEIPPLVLPILRDFALQQLQVPTRDQA